MTNKKSAASNSRLFKLVFIACMAYSLASVAQSGQARATLPMEIPGGQLTWTSPIKAIPLDQVSPFLSFFIVWEGSGAGFQVRFSTDGTLWSDWQFLQRDLHNEDRLITQAFITNADYRFFQLRYQAMKVQELSCHFFSPGASPAIYPKPSKEVSGRMGACLLPDLVDRSQWCPGNRCPPQSSPTHTNVSHLIIHHSAGTNTASDWAAVVRAIWDLHVNGNGWADIGYNYLIDPNGVLYEGRGNDILGAHFCGTNGNTMGVCVLGNFQESAPTDLAINSLVALLSWKADERLLNPNGSSFHASSGLNLATISGHRDGCSTSCPGDQLFPLLPGIREQTSDFIAACEETTSTPVTGTYGLEDSIRVFPNPVSEILQVELMMPFSGNLRVELLDLFGRLQREWQYDLPAGQNRLAFSLATLPAGSFLIQLLADREMLGRKVIIKTSPSR